MSCNTISYNKWKCDIHWQGTTMEDVTYRIRTSKYTMSLERKNINSFQMPYRDYVLITYLRLLLWQTNPSSPFVLLWNLEPEDMIPDRMIKAFLRRCPYCQITNRLRIPIKAHRFTCASCNPFEVLHLDHIGPLTKDAHGNEYILVIIDAFS